MGYTPSHVALLPGLMQDIACPHMGRGPALPSMFVFFFFFIETASFPQPPSLPLRENLFVPSHSTSSYMNTEGTHVWSAESSCFKQAISFLVLLKYSLTF